MKIVATEKTDRGLAYAEACFETFRVIDGQIFDWPGHWQRLATGLAEFGILLPKGQDEEILFACLKQAAEAGPDALVRLTCSGGEAAWGLSSRAEEPRCFIQAMAYKAPQAPEFLRLMPWPFVLKQKRAKFTADYAETLRALQGADDANVLFEKDGLLLASATANVLLYRNGRWSTPFADAGVLPGRVRNFLVIQGLVVEERCPVDWLEDCEALALSNSGVFIRPVAYIDGIQRTSAMDIHHVAYRQLADVLKQEKGVTPEFNAC